MQKLLKRFIIVNFLFCFYTATAQDVHLSQFYETPLMRNPALAGLFTGDVRVQAVYRNQWQAISYPYVTKTLSGEYKFPIGLGNDFMTIGLQTFHDVAGIARLSTVEVMPGINFHKSLNPDQNQYLSVGFSGGYVWRYFNDAHLTFDNQYTNGRYNAAAPSGENFSSLKRSFADFAAGISFSSALNGVGNYYLGMAMYHISKPVESFMNQQFSLQRKWQMNGGLRTPLNDFVEFRSEMNYLKQGPYSEVMLGALLTYHVTDMERSATEMQSVSLSGGAFLRLNDAVVPLVKLNYNNFEIGLSYDANVSKLKSASQGRGGYELSLSYKGFLNAPNSTLNLVHCPRF